MWKSLSETSADLAKIDAEYERKRAARANRRPPPLQPHQFRFAVQQNAVSSHRWTPARGSYDEPESHRLTVSQRGRELGHMDWDVNTGGVNMIHTNEEYQRKGVATAMYSRGREYAAEHDLPIPNTEHAIAVTSAGRGFTNKVSAIGGDVMKGQQPMIPRKGRNATKDG